jgi:serine/threonine protein phosphatase PrpC
MQSRRLDITTSGSTAIVALIKNNTAEDGSLTRTLYCANVGDSRAVLVCDSTDEEEPEESTTGFYGRRLSHDHKADDAGEIQRIKAAGGFVARSRVLGILAVSRSFGDHGMKDFVIADPYVTETILGATDSAPMLILACDGVWDVFSDQEACDFLMEKYKEKGGPFDDAAKLLVDESIERGSADNITVIVIFL